MAFSFVVVALDTDIPIFGVQVLSFGTPGALIFRPWKPFCELGGVLGNHGAAGGTRGGPEPDFYWF